MSNHKWKHPNAHKHGAFDRTAMLPGEDPKEFEALHSDLVQEWMPDGVTEEDAVLTIAQAMWRKDRAQRFIEFQFMKNSTDPSLPSYNEHDGLRNFAIMLRSKPEFALNEYAKQCLTPELIRFFDSKFPRARFGSTAEWAQAVINEIETVMLPERIPCDHSALAQATSLFYSTTAFTAELFDQELLLVMRIDAMIDRAVKRLIQTKAIKQMLGHRETERTAGQSGKAVKIGRARR